MEWLSVEVANRLQIVTLPLELCGLALALIEVRFKALTGRINAWLMGVNARIEESDDRFRREHPRLARLIVYERMHVPSPAWMHLLLLTLIAIALLGLAIVAVLEFVPALADAHETGRALVDLFLTDVYLPAMLGALGLVLVNRFVVRFAEDRAVGTLGIVIAGLGVAGEVYQFAVAALL